MFGSESLECENICREYNWCLDNSRTSNEIYAKTDIKRIYWQDTCFVQVIINNKLHISNIKKFWFFKLRNSIRKKLIRSCLIVLYIEKYEYNNKFISKRYILILFIKNLYEQLKNVTLLITKLVCNLNLNS